MNTGFVYKLVSKDINATECYVGSTDNTTVRKAHHKSTCNNVNGKSYNVRVYQYIRANGGFPNWDMIVLETVQYNEKYELKASERHHMEALGATLNSCVPNRTKAEYYEDNIELIKKYQQDNTEHIKQQQKQWREVNPEYFKHYKQENKEQIKQQKKQYYENNKEIIKQNKKQKHDCICGGRYTYANKLQHMKSKKHMAYLEK